MMKKVAMVLGAVALCIASFLLGHGLAISQARSIALTSMEVATSQMASSSLVRVVINTRILDSISAGKTSEAIQWACKDLSGSEKNLKELSELDVLNKESIQKAIETGDAAYAASCADK